jgi:hypothetical protein
MIGDSSVTLIGTLATETHFHTTPSGVIVASFTVLVVRRRPFPGRPGHFLDQRTHVPVTAFNKDAELLGQYHKRGGSRIYIKGHLEERRDRTPLPPPATPLDAIVDQLNFLDDLPPDAPAPQGDAAVERAAIQ